MKKKLSVLLISALVLTLLIPAFSLASATDVEGTKYESAVESLNALGVLQGYPDGTFKPNNTITRAEFAAVAIRLLGLEDAARVSKGTTNFSDMLGYEWASGYVNVANQKGIILGYPDGTFNPGKPVTQAEALTILVRVLGYEPIVSKEGWPTNYIIKAAELGLTRGIDNVSAILPATRGIVALFAENALYIDKMVQDGYYNGQPTYSIDQGNTLLTNNLGATEYTGLVTDSFELVDSLLKEGQFEVITEDRMEVFTTKNIDGLYGKNVTIWANDDNEVINVVVNDAVYEAIVIDVKDSDSPILDTVLFKGKTVRTKIASDAKLVLNYEENSNITKYLNLKVRYTLNKDGQIVYIDAVNYAEATPIVVDYVEDEKIINKIGSDLDLEGDIYNIDLAELNEFDVAYDFNVNDRHHLDIFNKHATGNFSLIYSDGDYRIGSNRYNVHSPIYFSSDNGIKVNPAADSSDFLGEYVNAILDANGKVLFVFASIEIIAPANYMAITNYGTIEELETTYYLKAINYQNKEQWYRLTEYTKFYNSNNTLNTTVDITDPDSIDVFLGVTDDPTTPSNEISNGVIDVNYNLADAHLDEDGFIASIRQPYGSTKTHQSLDSDDFLKDRNLVRLSTGWKVVSEKAVFFDITTRRFVTWEEVASIQGTSTLVADVTLSEDVATLFRITNGSIKIDSLQGIVAYAYEKADGKVILVLYQEGIIVEYVVDTSEFDVSSLNEFINDFVTLTISSGKVTDIKTKLDSEDDGLAVKSIGTLSITITNGVNDLTYYLEGKVLIYDVTGIEPQLTSLRDVSKNNKVLFHDDDLDGLIDVVLIVE